MRYNSIKNVCPMFVLLIELNNMDEIVKKQPTSWTNIQNSFFPLLGKHYIVMVVKVSLCKN